MLIVVVLLVLGVLIWIWVIAVYNSLVNLRGHVQRAWANVDVALKQRWDLIPNLVETVKGYAQHEREVFERIAELRTRALGTQDRKERIEVEQEIGRLVPTVIAWAEQYPVLRASENFMELQRQLSELEEEIADRRELYNEAVANYNIYQQSFPTVLVAQSVGHTPAPFFETAPGEREAPQVQLEPEKG